MNPNDVFPSRNLPNPSVPWGREIEKRVVDLEKGSQSAKDDLSNGNRTTAAVTSELARQLQSLEEVLEGLEDLYQAIPKTHQQTNRTENFSADVQWTTVNTISIVFPEGSDHVEVSAFGSGGMSFDHENQGLATLQGRMVIRNGSGPYVQADGFSTVGGWLSILTPQNTRSLDRGTTTGFDVEFQVRAEDSASFPADADNYANVTVIATFTG